MSKPIAEASGRFHRKLERAATKSICGFSRNPSEENGMRLWSKPTALVILSAAGILMVTMGMRQSIGLFVSPLNSSTGLGITTISLALAVAQLIWGVIQPVAGGLAD